MHLDHILIMLKLDKSSFSYTSLFCEENIWKLIESLLNYKSIKPLDVLFLINHSEKIAIFNQLKSELNQPVIWDYHVILSALIDDETVILDFDSRDSFPAKIDSYFRKTFSDWHHIAKDYQPLLKAINAEHYHQHFSSDRSHMRNIIPESEFPKYKTIQDNNSESALWLSECRDISIFDDNIKILTPENYLNNQLI